jgi:hypothetical protein
VRWRLATNFEDILPDRDWPEVVEDGVPDGGQVFSHVHHHAVVDRDRHNEGNGQQLQKEEKGKIKGETL